jgi:hypothetical protein
MHLLQIPPHHKTMTNRTLGQTRTISTMQKMMQLSRKPLPGLRDLPHHDGVADPVSFLVAGENQDGQRRTRLLQEMTLANRYRMRRPNAEAVSEAAIVADGLIASLVVLDRQPLHWMMTACPWRLRTTSLYFQKYPMAKPKSRKAEYY